MATDCAVVIDESAMLHIYKWLLSLSRDDDHAQTADAQSVEAETPGADTEDVGAVVAQDVIAPPLANECEADPSTLDRTDSSARYLARLLNGEG